MILLKCLWLTIFKVAIYPIVLHNSSSHRACKACLWNLCYSNLLPKTPFIHGWPPKVQEFILVITSASWRVSVLREKRLELDKLLERMIIPPPLPIISSICSQTQKNNPSDCPLLWQLQLERCKATRPCMLLRCEAFEGEQYRLSETKVLEML